MLFSIDVDRGEEIVGWILPDNPNATPKVNVLTANASISIEATVYRPLLKEQGLHNHGICGIVIDKHNCPGIEQANELKIVEASTGVLVYQRRAATNIDGKLLRVETQLALSQSVNQILRPYFQIFYQLFEAVPEETAKSILRIAYSSSIYIAGRIFPRAIDLLARAQGFRFGIVLRDPYEELAERLVLMRWSAERDKKVVGSILGDRVAEAAGPLSSIDLTSVQGLKKGLPLLDPQAAARYLSNPLARQLSCFDEGADLEADAVAMSLEYLSTFDACGLRSNLPATLELFAAVMNANAPFESPPVKISVEIEALADRLREVPYSEELVGQDLRIYRTACQALADKGNRVRPSTGLTIMRAS
jgi:hypothetical protein